MTYHKQVIELTPEQLIAYFKNELQHGQISSVYEPDGIFSSLEEKQQILEWLYNENRNTDQ